MSCRRSSRLLSLRDSVSRYRSLRDPVAEKQLVDELLSLRCQHPRFGYRRIHALLRRRGLCINVKKVYRIWAENGLNVPRKRAYRRRYGKGHRWMSAIVPNAVWAFDFLFDECANGQKLKIFAVQDEFTRESLAIEVEGRFRAQHVVATLNRLCFLRGKPAFVRCDNGPEFISIAIKKWAKNCGVEIAHTQPGKPWQNGTIESFNSRFRDECLDREWLVDRAEARHVTEIWRRYYNEQRPHSSIQYKTPEEMRLLATPTCQTSSLEAMTAVA